MGPVAAVGVRGQAAHPLLETRLERRLVHARLEAERVKRFSRRIADARRGSLFPRSTGLGKATPAEEAESVVERSFRKGFVELRAPMRRRAIDPHAPSGAMPVKIRLLIRRDGLIRHVLEVVVARIIGAHVIEAEMEIFAFPAASLGRAV